MDLEWIINTLDCKDNSCMFANPNKIKGMRTNGGCRCFKDLDPERRRFVHKMFRTLYKLYKVTNYNIPIEVDATLPPNEIHLKQGTKVVGKIININSKEK